jgi:hypothetical protein
MVPKLEKEIKPCILFDMQHLIILPGNSVKNRTWGEVMRDHYGPLFASVTLLEYEHWETGAPQIDFDVELQKLAERNTPLFAEHEIVVMAKSVGSLLTFVAIRDGVIAPKKCVFFGIPFDLAAKDIFAEDWSPVESFAVPALAFHNVSDPTADYRFTAATLAHYAPGIKLVTTNESDHWYGDTKTYDPIIGEFLAA